MFREGQDRGQLEYEKQLDEAVFNDRNYDVSNFIWVLR